MAFTAKSLYNQLMDRIEVYRRRLQADIAWGIGNVGCHDIEVHLPMTSRPLDELPEGEDCYVISVGPDGTLSVLPGETVQE